jgi:hypothetical protein
MNPTTAIEQGPQHYLLTRVEECLRTFDSKRQLNKHLALGLKLFAAFLSATITVLLGVSYASKPDLVFKNIAIGLSAFVAVINAWDAFFNHRNLWVSTRSPLIGCEAYVRRSDTSWPVITT